MQTIWDILGIEPATDKKTVKKAYAKALKTNVNLDDVEAFQKLREAYEEALLYVKKLEKSSEKNLETSTEETSADSLQQNNEFEWGNSRSINLPPLPLYENVSY